MILQPVFFLSYCTYSIYQLSCNLEKRFSSITVMILDLRFGFGVQTGFYISADFSSLCKLMQKVSIASFLDDVIL